MSMEVVLVSDKVEKRKKLNVAHISIMHTA